MLLSSKALFTPTDRHCSSGRTLSELEDFFQGLWLSLHAQPNFLHLVLAVAFRTLVSGTRNRRLAQGGKEYTLLQARCQILESKGILDSALGQERI